MEEALIAFILADTGVQAAVGNRVYWVQRPQASEVPAIVLTRISGDRDYHTQGPSGLVSSRVQADVYGKTYAAAKTAGRALIARLSGHKGGMFQGAFVDGERDFYEGDQALHRVSIDFLLSHT